MRNFHVHPNNANLCQPGINLDKLWSLVTEQVGAILPYNAYNDDFYELFNHEPHDYFNDRPEF